MDYKQLENDVETQIKSMLRSRPTDLGIEEPPRLMNPADLSGVYTDVMALGYNAGSIEKAVDDIYEIQSVLHGDSDDLHSEIMNRVKLTALEYPNLVRAFSVFHEGRKNGTSVDILQSQVNEHLRRGYPESN